MKTQECKSKHEINFSCSCLLKVIYIVAFAILAGVIAVAMVPLEVKAIAIIIGLFGFAVAWRQLRWLESLETIIVSNDGMSVVKNDGASVVKKGGEPEPESVPASKPECIPVKVVGGVFVSPLVVTFKCVPASNAGALNAFQKFWAVSVVVFRDSVSEHDHHILRTYLNTGKIVKPEPKPISVVTSD